MVLRRAGEVLMLQRSMKMPFAPGMHVFPGGGVSAVDQDSIDPLRACAIRETHEEVDILVEECSLFDRWITPEIEDRRYDVSFYLADVEDEGRLVTTEADSMLWIAPAEALERHLRGGLPMLRPTRIVLENLVVGRIDGTEPLAKLPRLRPDGSWDVIDASTGRILVTVDDGPTVMESDGRPSCT
jgi:8-oxo-dGTP pyrophosphatase MutT (NUDIX family)